MSEAASRARMIERRGDLLAEQLLAELSPAFLAQPTDDLGYDFFLGIPNPNGGVNIAAVRVKATENPVHSAFPIDRSLYLSLANSNVPVLLLVVNVKQNRIFYAMPGLDLPAGPAGLDHVNVHLTEVDDHVREELRSRLATLPPALAGAAGR